MGTLSMGRDMVKESWSTMKEISSLEKIITLMISAKSRTCKESLGFMKDIGKMILNTEKVWKSLPMELSTKVLSY